MGVTAVIPAYNEESRIGETLTEVLQYVDEAIVIDDASSDRTAEVAKQAGAQVLHNETNRGYIYSIKKGFQQASNDIIVTIDADGELPAAKIPELVQPIINGEADMVQGRRDEVVRPSEKLLTRLAGMKGKVGDSGTGFRAIKKKLASRLQLKGNCICGIFSLEVLSMGGRIAEIPIRLHAIDKPRKIAWYHLGQLFYLLKFMLTHKFQD